MGVFVEILAILALALLSNEITVLKAMYCNVDPALSNRFPLDAVGRRPCQCTKVQAGMASANAFKVAYYECKLARCLREEPLGMQDGRIPDESLTASSVYKGWVGVCGPQRARLNFAGGIAQSWCPQFADLSPWIQVDLKSKVYITGVVTQGRGDSDQRMTKYRCMYSDDGQQWTNVLFPNGTIAEFEGNFDRHTPVTARLEDILYARFLRILPTAWTVLPSMRFEVLGCQQFE